MILFDGYYTVKEYAHFNVRQFFATSLIPNQDEFYVLHIVKDVYGPYCDPLIVITEDGNRKYIWKDYIWYPYVIGDRDVSTIIKETKCDKLRSLLQLFLDQWWVERVVHIIYPAEFIGRQRGATI